MNVWLVLWAKADMSIRAMGMDLSGWSPSASFAEGDQEGSDLLIGEWRSSVPNICVLPRFAGEKPRAGASAMLTTWARGLRFTSKDHPWPSLGRVPAWLAWLALEQERLNPQWRYSTADGYDGRVPLSAILHAYAVELLAGPASKVNGQLKVVAIPDHFQERAQENLLISLPGARTNFRLLWRSVATCLTWTSTLSPRETLKHDGATLAIVDIENAGVSATILELRCKKQGGRPYLIPKRDLPENGSSARWEILPLDLSLCAGVLDRHGESYDLHEVWQLCCGHAIHVNGSEDGSPCKEPVLVEFASGWHKLCITSDIINQAALDSISRRKVPDLSDLWKCVGKAGVARARQAAGDQPLDEVLSNQVSKWLRDRPERPPDFLILAGVLDGHHMPSGKLLGDHLATLIDAGDGCNIVSPKPPCHFGVAHGCAVYGIREQAGLPTYLDTLPRFAIVGKDRLNWTDKYYSLVPHTECDGGKEYRPSSQELKRLENAAKILSGRRSVRFRLIRQDKEKQLEQAFDAAPLQDCFLSFDVRMRPAQGFARVRIIPELPDLFGAKEVVLDWDKMVDAEEQPPGPPDFPCCAPIMPKSRWRATAYVAPAIREYATSVALKQWTRAAPAVKKVGQQMQSGTACGSDPAGTEIDTLRRALEGHRLYLEEHGVFDAYARAGAQAISAQGLGGMKDLLRAATALFSKTPAWAEHFLQKEFREARARDPVDPRIPPVFLNAAGRCFSHEHQIILFVECLILHFSERLRLWRDKGKPLGMTNWCKSFQMILGLNEQAVLYIERQQADSLAECLDVLLKSVEPKHNLRLPAPYKQGMLSLYFLLRFRARPDGADFLSDWEIAGSTAYRIHANLARNKHVGPSLKAELPGVEHGETLQASLIRFLECRATAQDIVIMKEAYEESLDGEGEDDDAMGGSV